MKTVWIIYSSCIETVCFDEAVARRKLAELGYEYDENNYCWIAIDPNADILYMHLDQWQVED